MGQNNTAIKEQKDIVKQEESLCYSTYGFEGENDYLTDANDYYGKETGVQAGKVKRHFLDLNSKLMK